MLERWLRTPAGILALIGATFLASALLALYAVSQRAWFEGNVHEKFVPQPERIADIGRRLTHVGSGMVVVRELPAADRDALFDAWMQSEGRWPAEAPASMMWADPARYLGRARRTLVCGSGAQQQEVLRFLGASRHPGAIPEVERAYEVARARRAASLMETARRTLEACRQGLGRKGRLNR